MMVHAISQADHAAPALRVSDSQSPPPSALPYAHPVTVVCARFVCGEGLSR
jgi:hypothetical protein